MAERAALDLRTQQVGPLLQGIEVVALDQHAGKVPARVAQDRGVGLVRVDLHELRPHGVSSLGVSVASGGDPARRSLSLLHPELRGEGVRVVRWREIELYTFRPPP